MDITRWQSLFCRVGHDLAAALVMRKINKQATKALSPAMKHARELGYFMAIGYQANLTMTLRRQCTVPRDGAGISLKKLLLELQKEPQRRSLLRKTFVAEAKKVMQSSGEEKRARRFYSFPNPDEIFNRFAVADQETINPNLIADDIRRLDESYTERLASYADKEVAHLEKKPAELPLISEASNCLDVCWSLCEKYHTLFFAKPHMSEVGVGPENGWEKRFEVIRIEIDK
jgi:hypothetical protein